MTAAFFSNLGPAHRPQTRPALAGLPLHSCSRVTTLGSRRFWTSCLNAKSSEERVVYKKAELNRNVDSENNHGGSSRTYVLHRTGCSQEDDQLLRQGCERSGSPGRPDRSNTLGTGRLDEDASATLDRSHGSNDFHRLDLRSSAPARSAGEGSASADAARHRCGQEEERSHRCRQDRRLPALRLPAGMPHGIHRDSRQTPNPALPTPAGAPDGADEESDLRSTGVSHNKRRLHKVGYFRELLSSNAEVNESIRPLLRVSRDSIVRLQKTEYALVSSLQRDPLLAERIKRLRTVPGVGPITALTWALEMGEVSRFPSIREAISYCGLCGDEKSSADKVMRTPLSKQRNKHIQRVLVEAAK